MINFPELLTAFISRAVSLMDAASPTGKLISCYQTTQRSTPEDSYLHIRRRDNQKTQQISLAFFLVTKSVAVSRFVPLAYTAC
jgi:hypothetical protein